MSFGQQIILIQKLYLIKLFPTNQTSSEFVEETNVCTLSTFIASHALTKSL